MGEWYETYATKDTFCAAKQRIEQAAWHDIVGLEMSMNVYWLQQFWFDLFINNGTAVQRNLLTIQIPGANIFVNASLSAFGPGIDFDNRVVGVGGVGIKDFAIGGNPPGNATALVGHIELSNCTYRDEPTQSEARRETGD